MIFLLCWVGHDGKVNDNYDNIISRKLMKQNMLQQKVKFIVKSFSKTYDTGYDPNNSVINYLYKS